MKFKVCLLTCLLTTAWLALVYAQGFGTREDNVSYNGTRLTYYARPDFNQCHADCANNPNCQGYTWIKAGTYNANDPAMCYLLSAVTGRSAARGHYSAAKAATGGGGGGLTAEDNTDRPGADYKNFDLPQPNWALCRDACANDGNCRAYTYVKPGGQGPSARCWLKSSAPASVSKQCCISGVKGGGSTPGGGGGGTAINWDSNPVDIGLRGKNGQRFAFRCSANGSATRVWGTGIYTDDSRICTAAVHAGLITYASGGAVAIEILPGQNSYQASTSNGVTSEGFGAWHGSFKFVR